MDHQDIYVKLVVVVAAAVTFVCLQRLAVFIPNVYTASSVNTRIDDPIIGIDVGCSYMSAGVWTGLDVSIISNSYDRETTPTVITFSDDGRIYIGDDAQAKEASNNYKTFNCIGAFIGRAWDDAKVHDLTNSKFIGNTIIESNGKPAFQLNASMAYYPEEILAVFLAYEKAIAEDFLHQDINKAVLTVPAYFNDHQRRAVKNAGKLAGLDVVKTLNAPTAVAVYYSLALTKTDMKNLKDDLNILVIDFGASHLDVSIAVIAEGIVETLGSRGTDVISGNAINRKMAQYFLKEYTRQYHKDVEDDANAMAKLMKDVERVKRSLSFNKKATLVIEKFHGYLDFSSSLSRDFFEEMNANIWNGISKTIKKLLKEKSYLPSDINDVILTGGSSRIPRVKQTVKTIFPKQNLIHRPEMMITHGAAYQGAILSRVSSFNEQLTLDSSTTSLGFKTSHGNISTVVEKYTSLPSAKTVNFTTSFDSQSSMVVEMYEGEGDTIKGYTKWGQLDIYGIHPYRKGFPMFETTMMIDERGLYNFTVENKSVIFDNFVIKPAVRGLRSLEIPGLLKNVSMLVTDLRRSHKREKYIMKMEMGKSLIRWHLSNALLEDSKKKKLVDILASLELLLDDSDVSSLSDIIQEVSEIGMKLTALGLYLS